MFKYLAEKVCGSTVITYQGIEIDFDKPFERMTMTDCIKKYAGVDFDTVADDAAAKALAKELGPSGIRVNCLAPGDSIKGGIYKLKSVTKSSSGGYDLMLSIGQVVPHEVVGMANYSKNIFVGCGGNRMINASHMLGAFYGLERLMGKENFNNILGRLVYKPKGKLTLVPESDKREAISTSTAHADFEEV